MFKEVAENDAEAHSTQLLCCGGTRLLFHFYFQRRCWKSQNGLGQKGPKRSSHSHPLLYSGTPSTRSGCSKSHPAWTLPGMLCKCSVWFQVRKDRWGLFAVANQRQHSPEMCHSAAVLEWGKAEQEALYGWQGATGEGRPNSCSSLLKLKRLFGLPVLGFVWI